VSAELEKIKEESKELKVHVENKERILGRLTNVVKAPHFAA
jgi:hypothetical protein